ncbi:uncharacterized protein LOC144730016 isoform X1 [Lampetra planeri]
MSGSRACPDTQPGDCSERDDRETQEKRPLLLNAGDGARLPSERADDGADEAGSPGGESSALVRTPGEERGQRAATAAAAADDEREGERKSEPAPELNGEVAAGDGGALLASLGSEEGGGGGGDGTVVTVPPRASGRPNPCGGGAHDGAGGSEAEAPSAPKEERIAGEQRGAGRPSGRKKTKKTTAMAAANGKKRKPSGKSIASASQIPVEAADECCVSVLLACLFCHCSTNALACVTTALSLCLSGLDHLCLLCRCCCCCCGAGAAGGGAGGAAAAALVLEGPLLSSGADGADGADGSCCGHPEDASCDSCGESCGEVADCLEICFELSEMCHHN